MRSHCLRACANHGAQSPPYAFGHTDFVQRVDDGKLLDNIDLQAILPELLPDLLAAPVGASTNDAPPRRMAVESTNS